MPHCSPILTCQCWVDRAGAGEVLHGHSGDPARSQQRPRQGQRQAPTSLQPPGPVGAGQRLPEQLHRLWLETETPPTGQPAPLAPLLPFLSLFRNPACVSIHGPFLSPLPEPVCCLFSSVLLRPLCRCRSSFHPRPLRLSSMGKFPSTTGAQGRGRMERERKGARLQQKADGGARQRGETDSLNAHPFQKMCLRRVGVWRDPFSRGLNGFSSGLSPSPTHALPPRERAASAYSLRCTSHPVPTPILGNSRGRRGAPQRPPAGGWGPLRFTSHQAQG